MESKAELTVIILTYNESINISRAIGNTINWAKDVVILDSLSNDNTRDLANSLGAKVVTRKFDNYASQRNFAINSIEINTEWILFLDADEYLTEDLKHEIENELPRSRYDGYFLKRRFYFNGKWIKHGGYYPIWILRLFKKNKGYFKRDINEHLELDGKVSKLKFDFIDDNKKSLSFWWSKHIDYAQREALELFKNDSKNLKFNLIANQAQRKLWIRYRIWNKLPLHLRPFLYFFYR